MSLIYVVADTVQSTDTVRTIEQAAENIKQTIINGYYSQTNTNPMVTPCPNEDRIVITAGVVIDDSLNG